MPLDRRKEQRTKAENMIGDFIAAAEGLIAHGDFTQAEIRLREALKQADLSFGHNSRVVRHVLTIMADFYRSQNRTEALATIEKRLELMEPLSETDLDKEDPDSSHGSLLAIGRRTGKAPSDNLNPTFIPPDIRRACKILGLTPEQANVEVVRSAWKKAISDPSVHPDLGGEGEVAILLNNARDTVLVWLEEQSPKLLKKFGRIVQH